MGIIDALTNVTGKRNILTKDRDKVPYTRGWGYGEGKALAVVFPQTLVQQWQVIQVCVDHHAIILMQASNTGLTGGSVPDGSDYDRDIIIVKASAIHTPHLLNGGKQVLAFPGTTLPQLEKVLSTVGREIHSMLGSSCLGASVIGGVCNNSGGNLVCRGPVYTELALYAQIDSQGQLELVNHLEIDLGNHPEEILNRAENGDFDRHNLPETVLKASSEDYQKEVRKINQPTPARFNANKRYLYEASGSAGKLGIFAVRINTFPAVEKKRTFYIGTHNPKDLATIRKHILKSFKELPMMAEYMDRKSFKLSCDYARDVYLLFQFFGHNAIPKFLKIKNKLDGWCAKNSFLGINFMDKLLVYLFRPFFFIFPKRVYHVGTTYKHSLLLNMTDDGIDEARDYLTDFFKDNKDGVYFECNDKEAIAALNLRSISGVAQPRRTIFAGKSYRQLLYDIAYRRNDEMMPETEIPKSLEKAIVETTHIAHFLCHVSHEYHLLDTRLCDYETADKLFLQHIEKRGAKFPAEHNVGHKYHADDNVKAFYRTLDPSNTFNAGVGKMSKNKYYQSTSSQ